MKKDPKFLFYQYDGDHGQMHRDGLYGYYQTQKISETQEKKWAKGLADELLIKVGKFDYICIEFHRLISVIKRFQLSESLISVVGIVKSFMPKTDSFTKLLSSELILDTLFSLSNLKAIANNDKLTVIGIVRDIVFDLKSEEKYTIAPIYKNGPSLPGTFSDSAIEKRIMKLEQKLNNL